MCLMDGADAAIRSGEMDAIKQISYTIKDIYNLPEGKRAELINGQIYMMAPPSTKHQKLISALHGKIYNYIESHNGNCEIIPAPFAVFLKDNDENESYVEPDISVICDPDKIDDKGCHGSPDWIIEIVSSSSRKMDYSRKQFLYLEACGGHTFDWGVQCAGGHWNYVKEPGLGWELGWEGRGRCL